MNIGNAAQLVRPVPMMPGNGLQNVCQAPAPLMDTAVWQQWMQAVSSLQAARPGTPLQACPSPMLKQEANPVLAVLQPQQVVQAVMHKQANYNALSRSASPANISSNSQQNLTPAAPKASRHKYAEQRRRNRINERLDQLRTIIPHAEGINIAGFLDTVIEYVSKLQQTVRESGQGHIVDNIAEVKAANNSNNASVSGTNSLVEEESQKGSLKRNIKSIESAPQNKKCKSSSNVKKQKTSSEN